MFDPRGVKGFGFPVRRFITYPSRCYLLGRHVAPTEPPVVESETFSSRLTMAVGPAWSRGEAEAPKGQKNTGAGVQSVYNPEQQRQLGIDEHGTPIDTALNEALAERDALLELKREKEERQKAEAAASLARTRSAEKRQQLEAAKAELSRLRAGLG